VSKLTDADGEQQETQHWIETAEDCGYLSPEQTQKLNTSLSEIGRMINSMIDKADIFCNKRSSTTDDRWLMTGH
jgi:four helix bundle protein